MLSHGVGKFVPPSDMMSLIADITRSALALGHAEVAFIAQLCFVQTFLRGRAQR